MLFLIRNILCNFAHQSSAMDKGITIVIPVYNRERVVMRTLESVRVQTYRSFHLILVDNASTDGTREVLEQFKSQADGELHVDIVTEPRKGAAAARNAGLARVATEWCLFFDSDDVMLPGHLEQIMQYVSDNEGVDIVGWPLLIGDRVHPFRTKDMDFYNVFNSQFTTQAYCARTSLFRKVGGWREAMPMAEDVELGARLLATGARVGGIAGSPQVVVNNVDVSVSSIHAHQLLNFEAAFESIRQSLPDYKKHWADLRLIVLAANEAKGDPQARPTVDRIIKCTSAHRRWLWRLFYRYSLAGGRGVAMIYRMLFRCI